MQSNILILKLSLVNNDDTTYDIIKLYNKDFQNGFKYLLSYLQDNLQFFDEQCGDACKAIRITKIKQKHNQDIKEILYECELPHNINKYNNISEKEKDLYGVIPKDSSLYADLYWDDQNQIMRNNWCNIFYKWLQ